MDGLSEWWRALPSGDQATWATAVIALLALVAAGIAAGASWRVLRLERKRDDRYEREAEERRQQAARAEQADLVAAWHDKLSDDERATYVSVGGKKLRMPVERHPWGARVLNNSPLPVWNLEVAFLGPGADIRNRVTRPVMPPGEVVITWPEELRHSHGEDENGVEIYTESAGEFSVALTFRDAAGRKWRRDAHGVLTYEGLEIVVGRAVESSEAGALSARGEVKGDEDA